MQGSFIDRRTMLKAVKLDPKTLLLGGQHRNDLEIVMAAVASAGWSKFYTTASDLQGVNNVVQSGFRDDGESPDATDNVDYYMLASLLAKPDVAFELRHQASTQCPCI